MTLDLATRATGGYPADLRAAAGLKISKVGLRADISLDLSQTQRLDSAPAGGLVPVQDPATGLIQALDFSQLPTSNPADGSVANAKLTAVPSLTVKGNTTAANAQPQDVPLASLAAPGNPIGDSFAARLLTTGNDVTANPDTGLGAKIEFGNTAAKQFLHSNRGNKQQSLLGTTAITRTTDGSGFFGPLAADYGLLASITKNNWKTATGTAAAEGELNSIYSIGFQGKKGDVTILLGHVEKRRDQLNVLAADESGAPLAYEVGAYLVNAAGATYHEVHSYGAFIEQPVGMSKGAGYGYLTTAFKGAIFAAYGATVLNGAAGSASFQNLIFLDTTGAFDGSGIVAGINGIGEFFSGLPSARVKAGYRASSDTFAFRDENDNVLASFGRASNTVTVPKLQVGGGPVLALQRVLTGSAPVPTLTSLQVATIATLTGPAVANISVGDRVDVVTTSPEAGFSGYRLFGAVTAANTVEIRVQNLNSVTAGGVTIGYSAKVERFA